MESKRTVTLTMTLADGTVFTHEVPKIPRAWKSWLMRQAPYGTSFQGATFKRVQR